MRHAPRRIVRALPIGFQQSTHVAPEGPVDLGIYTGAVTFGFAAGAVCGDTAECAGTDDAPSPATESPTCRARGA